MRVGEVARAQDGDELDDEENAEREDGDEQDVPAAPDGVLAGAGCGLRWLRLRRREWVGSERSGRLRLAAQRLRIELRVFG